jgi:archaellin
VVTVSISLIILAAVLSMVVINMRTYKKRRNDIKEKLEA